MLLWVKQILPVTNLATQADLWRGEIRNSAGIPVEDVPLANRLASH
jgi:hypothetical protein